MRVDRRPVVRIERHKLHTESLCIKCRKPEQLALPRSPNVVHVHDTHLIQHMGTVQAYSPGSHPPWKPALRCGQGSRHHFRQLCTPWSMRRKEVMNVNKDESRRSKCIRACHAARRTDELSCYTVNASTMASMSRNKAASL